MVEAIAVDIDRAGRGGLPETALNYGVLERVGRCAERQGLTWLSFGLGRHELRLVVEGERDGLSNLLRGLKVGTTRAALAWELDVAWSEARRDPVQAQDLAHAVAWSHQAPIHGDRSPLSSPWSSHRDLLGYRHAAFFDPGPALARVDPMAIHRLAGGHELPRPRAGRCRQESLCRLVRVAAGLLGVMPAHRSSFRVFVHLARERGWDNGSLADALQLTRRRIRQLAEGVEPLLPTARLYLTDDELGVVP